MPQPGSGRSRYKPTSVRASGGRSKSEAVRILDAIFRSAHHAVLTLTLDGTITGWGAGAERLFGFDDAEVVGRSFETLVPPERLEQERREFARAVQGSQVEHYETERVCREGNLRGVCTTLVPVRGEAGEVTAVVSMCHDNQQLVRAQNLRNRLEAIIDASRDAIVSRDTQGIITGWSPGAEALYGYTRSEILGRHVGTLVPAHRSGEETWILERILEGHRVEHLETERLRKDGSLVEVSLSVAPVRDPSGAVVGASSIARDVGRQGALDRALREAEQRYRSIFENALAGIFEMSLDGRFATVNRAFANLLGYETAEEALALMPDIEEFWPDAAARERIISEVTSHGFVQGVEGEGIRRDGSSFWASLDVRLIRDENGRPKRLQGMVVDISRRKRAEAELHRRLVAGLSNAPIGVAILGAGGRFLEANEVACEILGRGESALIGSRLEEFADPVDLESLTGNMQRARHGEIESFKAELRFRRTGAEDPGWMAIACSRVRDHLGETAYLVLHLEDVTERRQSQETLARRAFHDSLTGLPNRALFLDRLRHAVARSRRDGTLVAVMFLDLDRFKAVNDELGHEAGDHLLLAVADRLRTCMRPGDTIARLGGDEFALLCEGLTDESVTGVIARRVCRAVAEPVAVSGGEAASTVSVGIAMTGRGSERPEALLKEADAAMYRAKRRGGDRFEVFDERMRALALRRLDTEKALRRAIDRGELAVHYQPQIDLDTGAVVGVEALLRWRHPTRGLLGPAEFMSVAENSRLIVPLGAWVLQEACMQMARWRETVEADPIAVSVNVSAPEIFDAALPARVAGVLDASGLRPDELSIEISEALFDEAARAAARTLEELKSLGTGIVVDNFGTRSSSLTDLNRFKVDGLKVDRSLIRGLETSHDASVVAAVAPLARALGVTAIAEGAETRAQVTALRRARFACAQGFYFAPPQPFETLQGLMLRSARQAVVVLEPNGRDSAPADWGQGHREDGDTRTNE